MRFGEAIDYMQAGYKVCRAGWNGKGMFLFIVAANAWDFEAEAEGVDELEVLPFICMKTADDKLVLGLLLRLICLQMTGRPLLLLVPLETEMYDLEAHLKQQRAWSRATFGPGRRVEGLVDHIRKELAEIEANPTDLEEWIDVVILALDGAWRCAVANNDEEKIFKLMYEDICSSVVSVLVEKQAKNEQRLWPDWRTAEEGKAIEHIREDMEPADLASLSSLGCICQGLYTVSDCPVHGRGRP